MSHILSSSQISLGSKKQNSVALSSAEAKYIAEVSCCAQFLYITQFPKDFGIVSNTIPLMYDNTSALNMAKNPVKHKRTNHID